MYYRPSLESEAWPYIVTVMPLLTPITLIEVKKQLRIDSGDVTQDTFLTALINAATLYAEKYTKKDLITRTYETFRDSFDSYLEIRRTPLQTIESVEYLKDDVLTTVALSIYFVTKSNTYPHLSLKAGQSWPTDSDDIEQAVKITFKSGYGDDDTSIPADIKQALLEHVSMMYENRGDCVDEILKASGTGISERLLPLNSRMIYDLYRIISV